jgi:orotate phosphoribosyltransferase-like protein
MNREQLADRAVELYEQGLIIRECADRLGVSKSTAYRLLKERGVKFRPGPDYYRNQWKARQYLKRAERRRLAA